MGNTSWTARWCQPWCPSVMVVTSSGDSGALGDDSDCYDGAYVASFPASATYVTAVGGTNHGATINLDDETQTTGEVAWSYSGGTFSIYFDTPEWQKNAYEHYFDQKIDYPTSNRYTANMNGVPDIRRRVWRISWRWKDRFIR